MLLRFRRVILPIAAAFLIGGGWFLSAVAAPPVPPAITPATRAVLDRISPASLREHLSFLASDKLEGRATPSPGLDLAADYIAAQFKRAGLEPAGDNGFFQTARWQMEEPANDALRLSITEGRETLNIDKASLTGSGGGPLAITNAPVVKIPMNDASTLDKWTSESAAGVVFLTELSPDPRFQSATSLLAESSRAALTFWGRLRALRPKMIVFVERDGPKAQTGTPPERLIDPESTRPTGDSGSVFMTASLRGTEAGKLYDRLPTGKTDAVFSAERPAPTRKPVALRNVVGILRGSDPVLRNTYVLVSAHYDHLGVQAGDTTSGTDRIYNGANDDGSGTVSVIELAAALARAQPRPRRSIVFITFFGEERGLLGSRFYARHPVVPLAKTVAVLNLEQVGRTDSTTGPQVKRASLTGFDYSDMGALLTRAGSDLGVTIFNDPANGDRYFARSDNASLAAAGVPAHTLSVAYSYPDYHGVDDEWEKIDYANMARVDQVVALVLLRIADNPVAPQWNPQSAGAAPFRAARQKSEAK